MYIKYNRKDKTRYYSLKTSLQFRPSDSLESFQSHTQQTQTRISVLFQHSNDYPFFKSLHLSRY